MSSAILIVEDDADTRDMLVRHLSAEGYSVKATDTLYGALHILHHNHDVGCMLLDYNLPGMAMQEFLTQLQDVQPKLEIVLMSAADKVGEKAERFGFKHYIGKPLDFDRLRTMLSESFAPPTNDVP